MTDDFSIRQAIDHIQAGRIRVPAFQRGFVWDPDRVAYLMDSLFKGYPIGSLLLWRTRERLRTERQLGPYELPAQDPDYPIDYVLDGQQRLTSVFGVFQTEADPVEAEDWLPVYFDYRADVDAQESQFVALASDQVDPDRHFPLNTLFDSVSYRQATQAFDVETAEVVDNMQAQFKEVKLPVHTFETDDRASVGIVFERVNRMGVELDTFQLLSAWTWSEDFDLQERFEDLAERLGPFGFGDVGDDTNLLLRCCAAIVARDASPAALVSLSGAEVRRRFDEIVNGIEGAIDFLRSNLHVYSLKNLPYSTLLVPLSVFFASPNGKGVKVTDDARAEIVRWFWRACFTRRYSSGVLRNLKIDIDRAAQLGEGNDQDSELADIGGVIAMNIFSDSRFIVTSVNTKTFVLMLAQEDPLSFVSGSPVMLEDVLRDYNRSEFHHVYPRSYLNKTGVESSDANRLVNFAFVSAQDNKTLGGVAPSEYRVHMSEATIPDILEHALCPESTFVDDYDQFKRDRNDILLRRAFELLDFPWPFGDA